MTLYDFLSAYLLYLVILSIIIVFTFKNTRLARRLRKLGPLEFDTQTNSLIDVPSLHCPHTKCQTEYIATKAKYEETLEKIWEKLQNMSDRIDKLTETVNEIAIDQLKLVFYNDNIQAAERLFAGLRYIAKKQNGDVSKDVVDFAVNNAEVYRVAIALMPTLRSVKIDLALTEAEVEDRR